MSDQEGFVRASNSIDQWGPIALLLRCVVLHTRFQGFTDVRALIQHVDACKVRCLLQKQVCCIHDPPASKNPPSTYPTLFLEVDLSPAESALYPVFSSCVPTYREERPSPIVKARLTTQTPILGLSGLH